jgi:hypothetical protein
MTKNKIVEMKRSSPMFRQIKNALRTDFQTNGKLALAYLANKHAEAYVRLAMEFAALDASIDPKESLIDERLERAIAAINRLAGTQVRAGKVEGGAPVDQPSLQLQSLPKAEDFS